MDAKKWIKENVVCLPKSLDELATLLEVYHTDNSEQQPEASDTLYRFKLGEIGGHDEEFIMKFMEPISHHPRPISEERIEELWERYSEHRTVNINDIIGLECMDETQFIAALKELK